VAAEHGIMGLIVFGGLLLVSWLALPILRSYGLPSTLIVPTAYAEDPLKPFWWDTLHKVLAQTTIETLEVPEVGIVPLRTKVERDAAYSALVQVVEHTEADKVPQLVDSLVEACGVEPAAEKHIIGWQEIEELAQDGDVTFAPHTRHHPILAQTGAERLQSEIKGSWELLARADTPCFSYGEEPRTPLLWYNISG
jgi:peptidoglycan/xylan/chitin deacetylase (PgdA/CDA1 family)